MNASVDFKEHFIKVPPVARPRSSSSQVVSIGLAKLEAPFSDGFVSENHAAHRQHLFNIAEAQGEEKVQPNAMTDDFGREAMTIIKRHGAHPFSTPHQLVDRLSYN
ncbi:MAG TPA: hypothetical protein VGJ66_08805 [Pyrinomonadaceae bacterium]